MKKLKEAIMWKKADVLDAESQPHKCAGEFRGESYLRILKAIDKASIMPLEEMQPKEKAEVLFLGDPLVGAFVGYMENERCYLSNWNIHLRTVCTDPDDVFSCKEPEKRALHPTHWMLLPDLEDLFNQFETKKE